MWDMTRRLSNIALLLLACLTDNGKYFYGNVGQDLIKRYQLMTLDFVSMQVTFEQEGQSEER